MSQSSGLCFPSSPSPPLYLDDTHTYTHTHTHTHTHAPSLSRLLTVSTAPQGFLFYSSLALLPSLIVETSSPLARLYAATPSPAGLSARFRGAALACLAWQHCCPLPFDGRHCGASSSFFLSSEPSFNLLLVPHSLSLLHPLYVLCAPAHCCNRVLPAGASPMRLSPQGLRSLCLVYV